MILIATMVKFFTEQGCQTTLIRPSHLLFLLRLDEGLDCFYFTNKKNEIMKKQMMRSLVMGGVFIKTRSEC
jgi:hypothetical protein